MELLLLAKAPDLGDPRFKTVNDDLSFMVAIDGRMANVTGHCRRFLPKAKKARSKAGKEEKAWLAKASKAVKAL